MLDMNPMQMVARRALLPAALSQSVPAAFAETPDPSRTSRRYQFISTARVIDALLEAGFEPTRAQQTRSHSSPHHARHMIRFSYVKHELSLIDAVPELILINAHDATSAYLMLIFACHHRRDLTCYPAYLQLNPRRGAMVTFSEELTVRNGEAGAPDRLIPTPSLSPSRRSVAHTLRALRASRGHRAYPPKPESVNAWIRPRAASDEGPLSGVPITAQFGGTSIPTNSCRSRTLCSGVLFAVLQLR
jgi:hypothetical protein